MSKAEDPAEPLYEVAPAGFVAARNALAAELKKAGKKTEAAAVKSLAKPPVSVFALNQVARKHPEAIAAVVASTDEIGRAQAGGVGNEIARKSFQAAQARQREALEHVRKLAEELLKEAGLEPGRAVMDKVVNNLRFGVLGEATRAEVVAGRLMTELEAPDFAALVERIPLAPRAGAGRVEVEVDEDEDEDEDGDGDGDGDGDAEEGGRGKPRIVASVPEQDVRRAARVEAAADARRLKGEIDKLDGEVARARKQAWAQKAAHDRALSQLEEVRAKLAAAEAELATRRSAQREADEALAAAERKRTELGAAFSKATALASK